VNPADGLLYCTETTFTIACLREKESALAQAEEARATAERALEQAANQAQPLIKRPKGNPGSGTKRTSWILKEKMLLTEDNMCYRSINVWCLSLSYILMLMYFTPVIQLLVKHCMIEAGMNLMLPYREQPISQKSKVARVVCIPTFQLYEDWHPDTTGCKTRAIPSEIWRSLACLW
jgi:hypothetical protein